MAIYIPVVQSDYMLQKFFDQKTIAMWLASGVLDTATLESLSPNGLVGDYVNVPKMPIVAFDHSDISSDAEATPTAVSTNDDKFPVLHDEQLRTYKDSDVARTGENFDQKFSAQVGAAWATRISTQLGSLLKAAVPSARQADYTGSALSVQKLLAAKALASDGFDEFDTLVCHSRVWFGLLEDMRANYANNAAIAGQVVLDGRTASLLGIRNIIVTDTVPKTSAGFSTAGDDIYYSFICRPNAIMVGYQTQPKVSHERNIRVPGNANYYKVDVAYALGLTGTVWGGSANPSNADFGNSSNWSAAYSDAREVGAIKILSKGLDVD